MDAATTAKFKPLDPPTGRDFSDAKVSDPNANVVDSNGSSKANFRDLLSNSNDDMARSRAAQKNGDAAHLAKTDAEFAKMMLEKANQTNMRKPQNELDKDAFLKLFVAQMRNQDPLNPDNSSQMAAQLAQFHGLEQMMNVNKNLEKMQTADAMGRAVGLISFVGKDIRLDNGKLMVESGKVATNGTFSLEADAVKTTLEVRDASGATVGTQDLGPLTAGEHKVEWNGRGTEGKPIGDGTYTFSVQATDAQGQVIPAKITSTVKVTGVDLHDAGGSFYTPIGKVRIEEVASVGAAGFGKEAKPATAPAAAAVVKDEKEGAPAAVEPAASVPPPPPPANPVANPVAPEHATAPAPPERAAVEAPTERAPHALTSPGVIPDTM